MQQIILGSAGFLLYFIYDINSVRKQNRLLQKFFAAGTILVVLSLFMELWFAWGQCSHRIGRMIGFGIGAMCFLALLIYTLFFALPFMVPGVSAASADAVYNVMTGDQTNWPMIIGISVAAGVAAIAIIVAIILTIVSKAKKNKGYKPKH